VVAAAVAAALAAVPLIGADGLSPALLPLGGVGLVGVLFALLGFDFMLAFMLFAFAAEFATRQLADSFVASVAIAYATGLLVLCELITSVVTLPRAARVDRAVAWGRGSAVGVAAVVGATASTLTLVGGSIRVGAALLAALIGVLAAVTLFAVVTTRVRS